MAIQKLYTLEKVAEITGWTVGSVRQYVARGVLPALRMGRKRVVQSEVLDRICSEGIRFEKKAPAVEENQPSGPSSGEVIVMSNEDYIAWQGKNYRARR